MKRWTYDAYMRSPRWRAIRQRALRHYRGLCCICGKAGATQVHHIKYPDHFGTERLYQLVLVHPRCHRIVSEFRAGLKR